MFSHVARCLVALTSLTVVSVGGELDVARVSQTYLGRPYVLGPLGEGVEGEISTRPLSDETRFDCTTFVETVLARAYARDDDDFACLLRNVRYDGGEVGFLNRLHLPDSEWIPHQIALGLLEDVTTTVGADDAGKVVEAKVDRGAWLRKLGPGDVKRDVDAKEKSALATELHQRAADYAPRTVRLDYLPLAALTQKALVDRLPSGVVFNVVRRSPRWIVRGQPVRIEALVSHQGFLVRVGEHVFVRSATQLKNPRRPGDVGGRVRDIRLDDYLKYLRSIVDPQTGEGNVLGLNLLAPRPRPKGLCP